MGYIYFILHAFITVGNLRAFDATLIGKYIFMNKLKRMLCEKTGSGLGPETMLMCNLFVCLLEHIFITKSDYFEN